MGVSQSSPSTNQYQFCVLSQGQPPAYYQGKTSIALAIFYTPPLSSNTNTPGDKIKTWASFGVPSGAGKHGQ